MEAEGCYCLALGAGRKSGRLRHVQHRPGAVDRDRHAGACPSHRRTGHAPGHVFGLGRPHAVGGSPGVRSPRLSAGQRLGVRQCADCLRPATLRRGRGGASHHGRDARCRAGLPSGRLPEFIAGTQRLPGDGPTHTPRADPMQAWSAAAVPFMTTELLGLDADGFEKRLHIRRPRLPNGVDCPLPARSPGGRRRSLVTLQPSGQGVEVDVTDGGDGLDFAVE